jgi:adenylate kinase
LLSSSNQKIDFIFFLDVKKETIIKRLEKRKILEKRSDDTTITILKRYDTYMETTKPVLNFYSKKPCFFKINGDVKIEEISGKIEQILSV